MNLNVGSLSVEIGRLKVSLRKITIPPALWFAVLVAVASVILLRT
jgi:hypothetical protein